MDYNVKLVHYAASSLLFIRLLCGQQHVELQPTFASESRAHMQVVANDIVAVVRHLMGRIRPPLDFPIAAYYRNPGVPITQLNDWRKPSAILIGLTAGGRKYDQFAYQLGHELGHVMLGPKHTNHTTEVLATALSLEVLDRLSDQWQRTPPAVPRAREYAPLFTKYRQSQEERYLKTLPYEVQDAVMHRKWTIVQDYLKTQRSRLISFSQQKELETENARALQHLAALTLRAIGIGWSHFATLNNCAPRSFVQNPEWLLVRLDGGCALRVMPELRRVWLP
jgi:hypothetical protein